MRKEIQSGNNLHIVSGVYFIKVAGHLRIKNNRKEQKMLRVKLYKIQRRELPLAKLKI